MSNTRKFADVFGEYLSNISAKIKEAKSADRMFFLNYKKNSITKDFEKIIALRKEHDSFRQVAEKYWHEINESKYNDWPTPYHLTSFAEGIADNQEATQIAALKICDFFNQLQFPNSVTVMTLSIESSPIYHNKGVLDKTFNTSFIVMYPQSANELIICRSRDEIENKIHAYGKNCFILDVMSGEIFHGDTFKLAPFFERCNLARNSRQDENQIGFHLSKVIINPQNHRFLIDSTERLYNYILLKTSSGAKKEINKKFKKNFDKTIEEIKQLWEKCKTVLNEQTLQDYQGIIQDMLDALKLVEKLELQELQEFHTINRNLVEDLKKELNKAEREALKKLSYKETKSSSIPPSDLDSKEIANAKAALNTEIEIYQKTEKEYRQLFEKKYNTFKKDQSILIKLKEIEANEPRFSTMTKDSDKTKKQMTDQATSYKTSTRKMLELTKKLEHLKLENKTPEIETKVTIKTKKKKKKSAISCKSKKTEAPLEIKKAAQPQRVFFENTHLLETKTNKDENREISPISEKPEAIISKTLAENLLETALSSTHSMSREEEQNRSELFRNAPTFSYFR